ncbi:hypothetical protein D3C75_874230 [compost metagenome]
MGQMPGDRLPFAVRVSRQIDFFHFFAGILQFLENVPLAADGNIFGFKIVFELDAHLALRKVADMAHGSLHDIFAA